MWKHFFGGDGTSSGISALFQRHPSEDLFEAPGISFQCLPLFQSARLLLRLSVL